MRKVIRLDEAQLRGIIAEVLGGGGDDAWTQLDTCLALVKRSVQGLQGAMQADPASKAHYAKQASAYVKRLQALVDAQLAG